MSNSNLNRTIRQVLYSLSHEYGNPVTVFKMLDAETDLDTGEKTAVTDSFEVARCVVLPSTSLRKFFQSVYYLRESQQFTSQGGQGWDAMSRGFIIEQAQLRNYEFQVEDWIVYKGRRYDVQSIHELEDETGWLIVGKAVRGVRPETDHRVYVTDNMPFEETANES